MTTLQITIGPFSFTARMEDQDAPQTCAAFRTLLPYRQRLIHARWSGEACWVPLGGFNLGVSAENQTSHPAPGEILWYPGGISETELLFPYGTAIFACKFGQLAGNHFLTIVSGHRQLGDLGQAVLWGGAQDILFEAL